MPPIIIMHGDVEGIRGNRHIDHGLELFAERLVLGQYADVGDLAEDAIERDFCALSRSCNNTDPAQLALFQITQTVPRKDPALT